jgi:hypothetical protein
MLALVSVGLTAQQARASHLRGVTLSWAPTGNTREVEFTFTYSQRRTFDSVPLNIGSTTSQTINFGDNTSGTATGTVTSINTTDDYYVAVLKVKHTYASAGPFTAFYTNSARISTIKNGANGTIRMETIVTPTSGNSSPVTILPPVVSLTFPATSPLPSGTTVTFPITASDADGDTLRYRLATSAESGVAQPTGLSVNNTTGIVSWNLTAFTPAPVNGDLWTTQIMVEDRDSLGNVKSKSPVDVILKLVKAVGTPPSISISPTGPLTVSPNNLVTFTVTGTDPDVNSRVTLNASGVPTGATLSPALGATLSPPVTSTFSWTPTLAQAGATGQTYVINFTATDDTTQQVSRSITINVLPAGAPTASSQSLTAAAGVAQVITLSATDPNGSSLTFSITGSPAQGTITNVGSPSCTTTGGVSTCTENVTYTANAAYAGADTFSFRASNGVQNSNAATVAITVNSGNHPPVAQNQSVSTNAGAPVAVTLVATDQDNNALTYTTTSPAHGTLSGSAPNLTYTPTAGYSGSDAFTFKANDGTADSNVTTVSITVNKINQTITFGALAGKTYGDAPFTLTATATSGLPVSFQIVSGPATVSGSTLTITGAGAVTVRAAQAGDATRNAAPNVDQSFNVAKATPTVNVGGGTFNYDGAAHGASATATGIGGAAVTGTSAFTYTPGGADAPVNAGDYGVSASFTSSDPNYNDATGAGAITIKKATATINVTPYNVTYDGAPHAAAGTATGVGGAPLGGLDLTSTTHTDAGTFNGDAWSFTDGTGNYNDAYGTVNDNISKASSATAVSCAGSPTYTGSALEPCTVTVTGANLSLAPAATYSNNVAAGTNTASASYAFAGDDNHTGSSDSKSFSIGKASSAVTVTCPAAAQTYTGSAIEPCSATATGPALGAGVSVTPVTYADNVNAGAATASATWAGDSNHDGSTGSGGFTIKKAASTTVLNFESGPYVYRGSPFTATAAVTGVGSLSQSVTPVYSGDCANVTGAGGCTATATFDGDANHDGSSDTKSITITRANAVVTVNGYTGVYDGNAHGASGSATGVTGENLTSLLNLGASFTNVPGGTAHWSFAGNTNYAPSSGDASVIINKADQTISWSTPASIIYGTALSATQLNATVSVVGPSPAGGLTYTLASGLLNAGTHQALTVNAAATQNYNAATKTVYLDVQKATPVIAWATPAAITYGVALSAAQLNATAAHPSDLGTLSGTPVSGTFAYTPAAGTVLPVGNDTLAVAFTPTNTGNYTTATKTVVERVNYGVCALYDQTKAAKSGSTIPIKLQLCNSAGVNLSSSGIVVHAIGTRLISPNAWGAVEDAGNANPDMDFRFTMFDPSTGGYIFNLQTKGLSTGVYQLGYVVGADPTIYTVQFQIK